MKKLFLFTISFIFFLSLLFGEIRSYLPHVVCGGGYSSKISIINLSNRECKIILQFYSEEGENWYVNWDGNSSFRFNLDLLPHEKRDLLIEGSESAIENGWCMVTSTEQCYFTEILYYFSSGIFLDETGFVPLNPEKISYLPVSINSTENEFEGVSILNSLDISQNCYLELFNSEGNLVDSYSFKLLPHTKYLRFISPEIFMNMSENFNGYLKISSDYGVVPLGMEIRDLTMSLLNCTTFIKPLRNENIIFVDSVYGSDFLGDGTIFKPYKTIKKAISKCASGNLIYLLPGVYSSDTGETFPINMPFCCEVMGSGVDTTFIIGGGILSRKDENVCVKGTEKSFISYLTVVNPEGIGIYSNCGFVVNHCKITSCGKEGIYVEGSGFTIYGCEITGNEIGIRILTDGGLADLGGGCRYSPGGNYIYGNVSCDLIFEGSGILGARFNFWDSEVPVESNSCGEGADIVETGGGHVRY